MTATARVPSLSMCVLFLFKLNESAICKSRFLQLKATQQNAALSDGQFRNRLVERPFYNRPSSSRREETFYCSKGVHFFGVGLDKGDRGNPCSTALVTTATLSGLTWPNVPAGRQAML
jgi:hypothetical protein